MYYLVTPFFDNFMIEKYIVKSMFCHRFSIGKIYPLSSYQNAVDNCDGNELIINCTTNYLITF